MFIFAENARDNGHNIAQAAHTRAHSVYVCVCMLVLCGYIYPNTCLFAAHLIARTHLTH